MALKGQSTPRLPSWEVLVRAVLFLGALLGAKALSAFFAFPPQENAAVWLPGGLTLAVFVRAEVRRWPVYLVVVFLAELLLVPLYGDPWNMAFFWAVGNCLRTVVGAGLMRRWLDRPVTFSRPRDVAALLVAGGLLSPLPSATLGIGAVALFGHVYDFEADWLGWYLSDGLGAVLFAPLLLTWRTGQSGARRSLEGLELLGTLLLLALMAHLTFGQTSPRGILLSLPYLCLPFVLWAALRLGPRGATSAAMVLGTIAIIHTAHGHGPFGVLPGTLQERVLSVQVFLAVASLSTLVLAAMVSDRLRVERSQRVLAEAGAALAESMEPRDTLPRVARLVVPSLASGLVLWMKDEEGRFVPLVRVGVSPEVEARLRDELHRLHGSSRRGVGPEGGRVLTGLRLRGRLLGGMALVMAGRTHPPRPRMASFAEDLAHHCALALENARLLKESQEAIVVRDDFIAVAAHELRTPLTALKLQLQGLTRLLRQLPASETVLTRFQVVARQISRLGRLVESLLDVERINTGRLHLVREPVDLGELVRDVLERLSIEMDRARCSVSVRVQEQVTGLWDRMQLEQALTNLLGNAMKFGVGLPIELEVEEHEGRARLTVRDQGIGVPPEALERIFGRFERAVSVRKYGGLGLGLFLTRQIVEAHGGTIQASSEPGRGATFILELPASEPSSRYAAESASASWPASPASSHPT
ncbi:MAG TPA: MASE1 domain-containing protein [Archangium sp.]|jgi:signal transduction histidine kinase|uniref:sensor histidine kinase n=1 Tax=Archangium sp. TaxID=1872627 RepID=UPI002ED7B4F0